VAILYFICGVRQGAAILPAAGCEISGYCRGAVEGFPRLDCAVNCLVLEYGTDMLSRNTGNQLNTSLHTKLEERGPRFTGCYDETASCVL